MRLIGATLISLSFLVAVPSVQAQEADLDEMQRSIEMFSGVLREGLELNTRAGIFSPFSGSVQGDYYMRQGVVLEITSPLANSRSSFTWQSFENRLQQLSGQISNLANSPRLSPPDLEAMRESMALSLRESGAQEAYREFIETVRNTDFSAELEEALSRASESALSLHELGKIDDDSLNAVMGQVNDMRVAIGERIASIAQLREEFGSAQQDASGDTAIDLEAFEARWQSIVEEVEPVLAQARAQAAQLNAQAEVAQQEREMQWQGELQEFEQKLFALVCDYGAALRALPANEHLTLVLKGLGDENENLREDRIHVLDKAQLQGCLQGSVSASALQGSAVTYSF